MSRYKKIAFKNFAKGETDDPYADPSFYTAISGVAVDDITQKLKLISDNPKTEFADDGYGDSYAQNAHYAFTVVYTDAVGHSMLYRTTDGITYTKVYDFPANYLCYSIFCIDGQIVAFCENTSTYNLYVGISGFFGTAFSFSVCPYIITCLTKKNGLYYGHTITGSGAAILTSPDFINWTIVVQTGEDGNIFFINYFKGFIHYIFDEDFYRLENDIPILIKKFQTSIFGIQIGENNILICERSTDRVFFYLYDGETFKKFGPLLLANQGVPIFATEHYAIVATFQTSATNYQFYKVFADGSFFKLYGISSLAGMPSGGGYFANKDLLQYSTGSVMQIYRTDGYVASGTFETTILDLDEHIPIALIVKHKPLVANTSVKIYAKSNQASSWGSALINSNTVGAIKKLYKFPAGTKQDFAQFKFELLTTDGTKTPEDVQLEFLYLPVGLENAK